MFIPLDVIILDSLNHDLCGDLAGWNQYRATERTIVGFLCRTGDEVIYRQVRGIIPCSCNDQIRQVIPFKILLFHGHSINSSNADDRQFVIDDENLRLRFRTKSVQLRFHHR